MTGRHDIVHHHTALVNAIKIHYVVAGSGPPVFLLHGFPEFWYAWRYQIPALAERYTVVAPDLRGYGYSAKPFDGYDKRTVVTDVRELARHLGYERIALIGHDRGARVALRFVKDSPEMVDRVAFLDNVPTVVVFETMDAQYAVGQWWFIFNQIPHCPKHSSPAGRRCGSGTSSRTGATSGRFSRPRTSPSTCGRTNSRAR